MMPTVVGVDVGPANMTELTENVTGPAVGEIVGDGEAGGPWPGVNVG
jgi:hypothetical protein